MAPRSSRDPSVNIPVSGSESETLLRGKTVMLVEDEKMVTVLLEDMLEALGCTDIRCASCVSAALEEIGRTVPDLAVLDVNLGNEMVYPVAEKLNVAQVPFVFTTGYGRGAIKLEWAARPCVQKPFNIDSFSGALRAALAAGNV